MSTVGGVPPAVRDTLRRIGVTAKDPIVTPHIQGDSLGDVTLVLSFHEGLGSDPSAVLRMRQASSPEILVGPEAAAARSVSQLDDPLWLTDLRIGQWGASTHDPDLTQRVLQYRADAALWHSVADYYFTDGVNLCILAGAAIAGRRVPVPTIIQPSPYDDAPEWSAYALFGDAQIGLGDSGLFSLRTLESALASALERETFERAPRSAPCASPLHKTTIDTDWEYLNTDIRAIVQLYRLCRTCAVDVLASDAPDAPIQPPRWGEKV